MEGDVNPVRDMEIIHEELRLKDLEYLNKRMSELEKVFVRGGEKKVVIFSFDHIPVAYVPNFRLHE